MCDFARRKMRFNQHHAACTLRKACAGHHLRLLEGFSSIDPRKASSAGHRFIGRERERIFFFFLFGTTLGAESAVASEHGTPERFPAPPTDVVQGVGRMMMRRRMIRFLREREARCVALRRERRGKKAPIGAFVSRKSFARPRAHTAAAASSSFAWNDPSPLAHGPPSGRYPTLRAHRRNSVLVADPVFSRRLLMAALAAAISSRVGGG